MLPVKKPATEYRTLEEIRLRKEELIDNMQQDNQSFTALWEQIFVKRENATRSEFITSMIANSVTAVDAFLLVRKLMKSYKSVFKKKKKR